MPSFRRVILFLWLMPALVHAQNSDSSRRVSFFQDTTQTSVHFQLTTIFQWHPAFHALYSGRYSLDSNEERATSVTSTLFTGLKLWHDGALYFNPELAGGKGISSVTGIAGFTNGETPRIGDPAPSVTIARLYLQQVVGLSTATEHLSDGVNQCSMDVPIDRITITLGKFAISDFFDCNAYSHDPRSQFQNWALMENGAWDYPANTHGYTEGAVLDAKISDWSFRANTVAVPTEANGETLEYRSGAHAEAIEIEHRHSFTEHPGVVRLLLFNNTARMGNYALATNDTQYHIDITQTRAYGRTKYGVGLNIEQEITPNIGAFLRAGWSDGNNETWAFTEIDRTISLGTMMQGTIWGRTGDCI